MCLHIVHIDNILNLQQDPKFNLRFLFCTVRLRWINNHYIILLYMNKIVCLFHQHFLKLKILAHFHPNFDFPVSANCTNGQIRLRGGTNVAEGRVEICYGRAWGTICDTLWGNSDAQVVCRQLGFLSTCKFFMKYKGVLTSHSKQQLLSVADYVYS